MEVACLIEDGGTFSLSENFGHLADAKRTAFAGSVGAGITDLLMNKLGYTWRDNADCLSKPPNSRPDFIYADGKVTGYGVVLAEAGGSFAMAASRSGTRRLGKSKYLNQVKPHLAKQSQHGLIVHGYSISFCSSPISSGAFLHVSETDTTQPREEGTGPTGSPAPVSPELTPTSLALASHRSNFALIGAPSVVAWIDWLLGREDAPEDRSPAIFLEVTYAGRKFLLPTDVVSPYAEYLEWQDDLFRLDEERAALYLRAAIGSRRPILYGQFAMEINSAEQFLNSLSLIIRERGEDRPEYLVLPRAETVGFSGDQDSIGEGLGHSEYDYAVYGDGLALLRGPFPPEVNARWIWAPTDGLKKSG